jgi:hypothetical protein
MASSAGERKVCCTCQDFASNTEGTSKLLPPSFGSDNTGRPSLEEKVSAPVAVSTVTTIVAVESLTFFFPMST